jgi:RND superfamily putative drug exporter
VNVRPAELHDSRVFGGCGKYLYRHRRVVLWLWLIAIVAILPTIPFLPSRVRLGGFDDPSLPSWRALVALRDELGFPTNSAAVFYKIDGRDYVDPIVRRAVGESVARAATLPGVKHAIGPDLNSRQVGKSGRAAFAIVALETEPGQGIALLADLERAVAIPASSGITVETSVVSADAFFRDLQEATANDLRRAELITVPVAALTLLAVFGSVVAAGVPVIAGVATAVLGLGGIFALSFVADMSVFTLNLASMLALGLGTDYALFLVSRFREEIDGGADPEAAVTRAVATAGRAVFFSAGMVLAGLGGLVGFNISFLRSLGLAGLASVAGAVVVSMTLIPALLGVIGTRIDALRLRPRQPEVETGFWSALASLVTRRPLPVLATSLVVLVGAAWPFLGARLSTPDSRILPADSPSRRATALANADFDPGSGTPLLVIVRAPGPIMAAEHIATLRDVSVALERDPRVARVDGIVSLDPRLTTAQYQLLYANPAQSPDQWARGLAGALVRDNITLLSVTPSGDPLGEATAELVDAIRATVPSPGWRMEVGGVSAGAVDLTRSLYSSFPGVIGVILATTAILLFFTFRSILLPIKAILMNLLSLGASYGALVLVFQDGILANLPAPFAFPAMGYVESTLPILLFCTLFGLSMDYEVFLLSRVREEYLLTNDNIRSVTKAIGASARVITGAAAIVVAVAGSFSLAADVVQIKALGLGIALAVLADATIVRGLLVPATMRLLGEWNWWVPASLAGALGWTSVQLRNNNADTSHSPVAAGRM